ncbi:MAG: FAD-dependent monooxygenase [Actinomycetes bacterium]|jgi:2-polyprenyl-6-methoxyphenol hydroxylase-like FAD-dependent oxidoreductase|nr:MAG: FAD-dependent oxidoreductase [Actinomycetota bacterium]
MKTDIGEFTHDCDVVIVGAGPVGLMVGCELRLAGVRVTIIERRTEINRVIRAFGLTVPTVEAFYRRGLLPDLIQARWTHVRRSVESLAKYPHPSPPDALPSIGAVGHFAGIMIPRDSVDHDDPDFLERGPAGEMMPISQQMVEEILTRRASAIGVDLRRGVAVETFEEQEDGVDVRLSNGERLRCGWLVGCDGGRSTVRRLSGFPFLGTNPEITGWQAIVDFENPEVLQPGWNRTDTGIYVFTPLTRRILIVEMDGPPEDRRSDVTREELQAALRRVSKTDITITSVDSATRFTDHARQASTYVKGRIILAGDAAHVHPPFGGQGLNLGIGDAMNLGWKLAATVQGWAPCGLLDSYTRERHPIGASVLDWARAQIALMRLDPLTESLRRIVSDLLCTADGATYAAKKLSGVVQKYDMPGEHRLVGRSAPDVRVGDQLRLADLMHRGQAVLIGPPELGKRAADWHPRLVHAESPDGPAMLVRPDGYVAWASDDQDDSTGLDEALHTWLGDPGL